MGIPDLLRQSEGVRIAGHAGAVACLALLLAGCLRSQTPYEDSGDDTMEITEASDLDMAADAGGGGCDQDVPWPTLTPPTDYCSPLLLDDCPTHGCPACHVCNIDFACGPPPWDDPMTCSCFGDGKCYRLCESDEDCSAGETCIMAYWFCGYDAPNTHVHLCWPDGNPPFGH